MSTNISFRYALSASGTLIDILSLPVGMPKADRPKDTLCAGCQFPVVTRLGTKRARHFAHVSSDREVKCSPESYLHYSAKAAMRDCLGELAAAGKTLQVVTADGHRIEHQNIFGEPTGEEILPGSFEIPLDGSEIFLERRDERFIPDVLVTSGDRRFFFEVAVTHACEPEKISAGLPIIEFSIQSEEDIATMVSELRSGRLDLDQPGCEKTVHNLGFGTRAINRLPFPPVEIMKSDFVRRLNRSRIRSSPFRLAGSDDIHDAPRDETGFLIVPAFGQAEAMSLVQEGFASLGFYREGVVVPFPEDPLEAVGLMNAITEADSLDIPGLRLLPMNRWSQGAMLRDLGKKILFLAEIARESLKDAIIRGTDLQHREMFNGAPMLDGVTDIILEHHDHAAARLTAVAGSDRVFSLVFAPQGLAARFADSIPGFMLSYQDSAPEFPLMIQKKIPVLTRFSMSYRAPITPASPVKSSPEPEARPIAQPLPAVKMRVMVASISPKGALALHPKTAFGRKITALSIPEDISDLQALDLIVRKDLGFIGKVRSCLDCRHHAFAASDTGKHIFCAARKQSCYQNAAADCPAYKWLGDDSRIQRHRNFLATKSRSLVARKMAITPPSDAIVPLGPIDRG